MKEHLPTYGLFFFSLLVMVPRNVWAQSQAINGTIQGAIRDDRGVALARAAIVIRNLDTGTQRKLVTDARGRYRAPLLPLGSYEISAGLDGFATARRAGIVLEIAQTLNVDFILKPASAGQNQDLLAKASFVETERKQPSTTLNERFVNNLPLSGRKFLDLGVMVPGATEFGERDSSATADFAGVSHFFSSLLVDGTEAYQAWTQLPRGRFVAPFEFSQDAVREFQVLNSSFTAEFGRSAGGLMNVITKSGANQWHGDAFYFMTGSRLNATPRFVTTEPDTLQQQFGGALGGPIRRDKVFFFTSYDQQVRTEPIVVTSGTVLNGFDTALRSITDAEERQKFLEAGDFIRSLTGDFSRSVDQFTLLGKTDWQVTQNHNLSVRFNHHNFKATNLPQVEFGIPIVIGTALSNAGRATIKNNSLVLQFSSVLSSQVLNEARFQFAAGDEQAVPNGEGPQVRIGSSSSGITFGRSENFPASLDEKRWQWIDNLTVVNGRHEMKTGFDINHVSDDSVFLRAINGAYQFDNLRNFASSRYLSYTQSFGQPEVRAVNRYYNFFVQDNIRVTSSFSLNIGLRYELQSLEKPSLTNPAFPQTRYPIADDKNNFAPRFGFAWAPGEQKTVVRGNYGIYYGALPILVNAAAITNNGVFQASRFFRGPADSLGPSPGAPTYPAVLPPDLTPQSPAPGSRITVFSPDFAQPYVQQANIEIERELTADLNLSIGWIFTKGTRLRRNDDINLFPPTPQALEIRDSRTNLFGLVTIPSFGGPASRPFPFFDRITEFKFDNTSTYHSFFVQGSKRYRYGFQLLANYTLSKLIESGFTAGDDVGCCASENPFDPRDERGIGRRDQTHRFNLAAVWDTPNVATGNVLAKALLNRWQLNPIIKVGNGRPYTATVTGASSGDINGNGDLLDRAPFYGRNTFRGPGYASVDLRIQRSVNFDNRRSIAFIVEFFNLFNRGNFLRPFTDYFALTEVPGGVNRLDGPLPIFGQVYNATRSREIQFAVRFSF